GRGRGRGTGQGQRPGQRPGQGRGQGQRPGQVPGQGPPVPRHARSVPAGSPQCPPWLGPIIPPCPGPGALTLTPRSFSPRKKQGDNMKPKHPDEQEIPFRLRELIRSREAMKRPDPGKKRGAEKKKQQQHKSKGPAAQGDPPGPRFRRGRGESERSYICRMEQEVQRVLFLAENQLQREPEKEELAPEKSKRKKEFQNKKLEKARKKKEEKKEAMLEKRRFQDTVAFGEVVTQPPTITSWPRGRGPAEQAGQKRLLLTPKLCQAPVPPAAPVSLARRRILEEERSRVVQAYRDIQRRKQQQREVPRGGGTQPRHRVPP
ncbi:CC137 protein, partial [Brachypteracias leptosomus]|nr:CC137 protein [Brachypteracias leptosomus]